MSFILIQQLPDDPESEDELTSGDKIITTYFVGDTVCKLRRENGQVKGVQFGIVTYPKFLKLRETLESVLRQGFHQHVPVYWHDTQSEQLENALDENIFLVERQFSLGLHVRRNGLSSGNVIAVERVAALEILGTNQVISNVPIAKLQPLEHKSATLGSYVLHQEWLGIVTAINFTAHLQMADGTQCTYTWTEAMEEAFQPPHSQTPLHQKILYPSQIIQLTKRDILQVNWNSGIFEGKVRVFRSNLHSLATVIKIDSQLTVEWLESLPRGFHERRSKPAPEISFKDLTTLDSIFKSQSYAIGNVFTLQYWGEKAWQIQTYEDWLQTLPPAESQKTNCEVSKIDEDTIFYWGDNGGKAGKEEGMNEALKIWNNLKTTNVDNAFYGEKIMVKVLCTQSWVTVRWPNYLKHIEYLSSCEFEPMIFAERPVFRAGTAVKFNREKVGSHPCFCEYYGVVIFSDAKRGLMTTNWYKYHPSSKPTFVGSTKSSMEEVEPHSDFRNLTKGSLVTWNEPSELHPEISLGIIHRFGEDGMVKISTKSEELLCWPENLIKIPTITFYDAPQKKWGTEKGNFTHISPSLQKCYASFTPSLEDLSGCCKKGQLFNNNDSLELEILEKVPILLKFQDLPKTEISDGIFRDILRDMKLYSGEDRPGIWLKTFSTRKDLISVAMEAPQNTLYEDLLLIFMVKIPQDFPNSPPLVHFYSFSPNEINPCLKTTGQVLFPLLNTYDPLPGFHNERWDPQESTIGLVLVCIRKLILCDTPFKHHRSLELLKFFSTSVCNNLCLNKNWEYLEEVVQSFCTQLISPPEIWREDLYQYYRFHIPKFYNRWIARLESNSNDNSIPLPSMPTERIESLKRKLYHLLQLYQQTLN